MSESQNKLPPINNLTEPELQRPWQDHLRWWLLLLSTYFLFVYFQDQQNTPISYSQFKQQVKSGQVKEVVIQGDKVNGVYKQSEDKSAEFIVFIPAIDDSGLIPLLENNNVEIKAKSGQVSWLVQIISSVIPWVFFIAVFWLISSKLQQRMGGGLFGFSQSKAKRFEKLESKITFKDIAGLDNAKQDLLEITDYLKNTDRYKKMGAKMPRGVLLMGPPGTGKTLLAKAVAGEATIPFFSISGSEFIEMFVGVGASRVRDMFDTAKQEAPSIIFIDEIDSVGRARGTGLGGGHDEREQTLNQILNEMDGFEAHEPVVVLAATNRPDVLDAALLRPGRFDRKITLDLPDKIARIAILKIHAQAVPLDDDVDLDHLASLSVGFSGADLENLINEAALLAIRENKTKVNMETLLDSRDKVILGGEREDVIDEDEKRLVAFHEAGHALVALLSPKADSLDKVTIIPRGGSLGHTEQIPLEKYNLGEAYLRDSIAVMLGGKISEQLTFGETSTGSENDLIQATTLARHMVTHWGMSKVLGPVAFARGEGHIFLGREMAQQREFSEHTAQIIDDEIGKLLKLIEAETIKLLQKHSEALQLLAVNLLEKETLDAVEVQAIIGELTH